MTGFTKTGQPVQGREYTLTQGDLKISVRVVGKAFGNGGNADLVAVMLEDPESGGRDWVDWPIEASDGAPPIRFTSGWSQ